MRVADAVVAKPAMPILGGDGDSAVMVFCYQGGSGQVVSSSVVAQQLGCLFYLFFFFFVLVGRSIWESRFRLEKVCC